MPALFSVIIPVAPKNSEKENLLGALENLSKQTFKSFEIIVVGKNLNDIGRSRKIKVLDADLNKSEARNLGARVAKGKFLVHIDTDYRLNKNLFTKTHKLIKKRNAQAVIFEEAVKATNPLSRARQIEKNYLSPEKNFSAPQVISKKVYNKIGGFDEEIDELDDWGLGLKLSKTKVKIINLNSPKTIVSEPINPFKITSRKFKKGRYYPLFLGKYNQNQTEKFALIFKIVRNELLKNPFAVALLFILKIFDQLSFTFGSFFPRKTVSFAENIYQNPSIASNFDQEQESNYSRYKHFRETKHLQELLPKDQRILELGSGSGRITKFLDELGHKVVPTDPSPQMLKALRRKNLPKALLIEEGRFPFANNSFDSVLAFRVIWHIRNKNDQLNFLKESLRISKSNVILDFSLGKYRSNFLIPIIKLISPNFYSSTTSISMKELKTKVVNLDAQIENVTPLETLPPLWLNLLPKKLATTIFRMLDSFELSLARVLKPGRVLVSISKNS